MEPIEGSETSAFKPQTPGKYPKENILHKEHGESLKSRHLQGATLLHDKITLFLKKFDFSTEQCSCLKMILGLEHVGAIFNFLTQTKKKLCICISWSAN